VVDHDTQAGQVPARCRVRQQYANALAKQDDVPLWVGKATTKEVEFELGADDAKGDDPLASSKPVRASEVEFRAVIEPKCPAPAKGAERAIDLGFRISNPTRSALLFDLNRLEAILKTADGIQIEQKGFSKDSAFAAPVQLEPGASRTVLWRGTLDHPAEVDAPRLRYVDGTAFGGIFEGLKPGKYRLSFRYEVTEQSKNTIETLYGKTPKELLTWTGTVTTDEVAFEILPAQKATDAKELRPVGLLLAELESADGATRVAATSDLFDRGNAILADLERAGAKPIAPGGTIDSRRLDVVYSLIKGLPAPRNGGFVKGSFGLHLDVLQGRDDVDRMGKQYGFALTGDFTRAGHPNCYVKVDESKRVADMMRAVLMGEPRVITLNLNYVEKR
jgi:hypothetical protein